MVIKLKFCPVGGNEGTGKKRPWAVGNANSETTLEENLAVAYTLKHTPAILSSHLTSRYLLKRTKDVSAPQNLSQMFIVALFVPQTGNNQMSIN